MINKHLLLVFLLLTSTVNAAYRSKTKLNTNVTNPNRLLNRKELKLTRSEKRASNRISNIYKMANDDYLNLKLLYKTRRNISRSSTFKEFKPWIDSLIRIRKSNHFNNISRFCNSFNKKLAKGYNPKNFLLKQSRFHCLRKTLEIISKNITRKRKFYKSHLNFIIDNLKEYTVGRNEEHFNSFLDRISNYKDIYRYISSETSKHMIQNNIVPNQDLLSNLYITPELTYHVQVSGLNKKNTKDVFYTQLINMTNEVYAIYDENRSDKNVIARVRDILNFVGLNPDYIHHSKTYKKLIVLSKFLLRREEYSISRFIFSFVAKNSSRYKNKANFLTLWSYLVNGKYSEGQAFILAKNLNKNYEKLDENFKFWIGFTLMNNSDITKAKEVFSHLIDSSPLSFYSIIAYKELLKKGIELPNYDIESKRTRFFGLNHLSRETINQLKRIKLWSDIYNLKFLRSEIASLKHKKPMELYKNKYTFDFDKGRSDLLLLTSNILNQNKDYINSFRTIYKGLKTGKVELNEYTLSILFPKPFLDKLKRHNKKVDPLILLSLIRQESGFNPKAVSRVGARGLMQLMPSTARQVAKIRSNRSLNNANTNIKIGSKYFKYLFEKHDENLVYTLSAYNAGENRIKRWRREFFKNTSLLHNIESIPFKETRQYVQLIYRNIFFYKLLTEKNKKNLATKNKVFKKLLSFRH